MIGALIGIGIAIGILLTIIGFRPPAPSGTSPSRRRTSTGPQWMHLTSREKTLGAAGLLIGVVMALFFGWLIAVVVVPLLMISVPRMMAAQDKDTIAQLEAVEEWTRSLRGMLGGSVGPSTAIVQTLPSAPEPLKEPLERLVARIHAHHSLDRSLYAFADEVNSQVGDFVAAALIQASRVSGAGLTRTLDGISAEVADEVRMRRDIAVERDKGITQARWLTVIAISLTSGLVLFTNLGEVYRTPSGQVVLLVLIVLYALSLRWVYARARSKPAVRFLVEPSELS